MQITPGELGQFDLVIGNPPYGADLQIANSSYLTAFKSFASPGESYALFVERGTLLLREGGLFGYIIPDTYLNLAFTAKLRSHLLEATSVREIIVLPSRVFEAATVDTTILIVKRDRTAEDSNVDVTLFDKKAIVQNLGAPLRSFQINTREWKTEGAFNVQSNPAELALVRKLEEGRPKVKELAEMFSGVKSYEVGKGTPKQTEHIRETKPYTSESKLGPRWSPFLDGKHIGRYQNLWKANNWIDYGPWLAAPRDAENFEGDKLLIRKIVAGTLICMYVDGLTYCNTLLFILKRRTDSSLSLKYLLGILNSRLMGWYFGKKFQISSSDAFPQIMVRDILEFPVALSTALRK